MMGFVSRITRVAVGAAILIPATLLGAPGSSSSGLDVRSWTISSPTGDIDVSQVLVPVEARLQVRPNLDLSIADAGASSNTDVQGDGSTLNGATALSCQAFLRVAGDRLQLQGGATVPSGARGMNTEETGILRLIGLPLLQFGLRHYGRGPEFSLGATAVVQRWDQVTGSISAGFITRGAYELFEGIDEYDPASEWVVHLGADLGNPDPDSRGALWHAGATARFFGTDRIGESDSFREGDVVELGVSGLTRGYGLRWTWLARAELKGDNTHYGPVGATLEGIHAAGGNSYFIRGGSTLPMNADWRVGIDLEWNRVTGSEEFGQNGYSFGFGPALERQGESITVSARARYLGGELEALPGGEDMSMRGFGASASVRWWWGL